MEAQCNVLGLKGIGGIWNHVLCNTGKTSTKSSVYRGQILSRSAPNIYVHATWSLPVLEMPSLMEFSVHVHIMVRVRPPPPPAQPWPSVSLLLCGGHPIIVDHSHWYILYSIGFMISLPLRNAMFSRSMLLIYFLYS
jgi:hypothetical protein